MRISDWSSDVCSSDLVQPDVQELARVARDLEAEVGRVARDVPDAQAAFAVQPLLQLGLDPGHGDVAGQPVAQEVLELADLDRNTAVQGKSVSVRLDLRGRRKIQKKINK